MDRGGGRGGGVSFSTYSLLLRGTSVVFLWTALVQVDFLSGTALTNVATGNTINVNIVKFENVYELI